jgi:beta-phosphoglucomutase
MSVYKAAIFDFNGTLLWDTSFHNAAFDVLLAKHGKYLTDEEKRQKIHGKTNALIFRGIFGESLSDDAIVEMSWEKESIYRDLCVDHLRFAPGAEDLFNQLQAKGVVMTIATSSEIENLLFYFEKMDLERWFAFEKVAYDNGTFRGKPHPDVFLTAAKLIGVKTSESVIFEDSKAGIEAAQKAKAGKIYIVDSFNTNYDAYRHDIITHFSQVDTELFGSRVAIGAVK